MSSKAPAESKSKEDFSNRYKDTIDLPQTDFPMRGNGPVREPEFQEFWDKENVYGKNLENRSSGKTFVLHDGPPYLSSDKIHIGTALNKILKDIVVKYKSQEGFYTRYIPGYDSHGLPIENAVVKSIKGGRAAVSVLELRQKCKEFALGNLKGQEERFRRLGVFGDWDKPYVTLQSEVEAEQIRLFAQMAAKGYVYRDLKTVYWSYGCETALADAEVEYNEEHVSNSIYVAFKIKPESLEGEIAEVLKPEKFEIKSKISNFKYKDLLADASVLIWTTTPWTIPGNYAICLHKDFDYVIVDAKTRAIEANEEKGIEAKPSHHIGKLVIAKDLVEAVASSCKLDLEPLVEPFKGAELEGLDTEHPLFKRSSPVIFGSHVTIEGGTGCVHTAPGHGHDDFFVGKEYGLEIICPVDSKGRYTAEAGLNLESIHVVKEGNDVIMALLAKAGALISRSKITHSYPYCWRSKTPLLYRATEQWFASVDGFRAKALEEIDKVQWIPERGRNRIYAMVEDRGDWCISRQRTWGVPIPVFYDKTKPDGLGGYEPILDLDLIEHIAGIFSKEGSDAWYAREAAELLPKNKLAASEAEHGKAGKFYPELLIKETDTMDVWFDSGSTHRSVVQNRAEEYGLSREDVLPVDLYLEGSDQHRGWFQSSLLTSVACNDKAPYRAVLTHGFVMDEKGRKMSKSLGNVVDPEKVIKQYGADILRLWVASVDYSVDIKVGDSMFKQLADIYRNLRNTSRYMLGNLHDFDPEENYVNYDELWEIDKLLLHRLQKLIEEVTVDFDKYQFFKYYQILQNFCAVDLSAFYFDILKDRLYTHGTNSPSRRSAQTVLFELLSVINRLFVPVLPHLAEDVFKHSPEAVKSHFAANGSKSPSFMSQADSSKASITLSNWPKVNESFVNDELASHWERILWFRTKANEALEEIRASKLIGKSLEASVEISAPSDLIKTLESVERELESVLIVSNVNLVDLGESETSQSAFGTGGYKSDAIHFKAEPFVGEKCVRCWKVFAAEQISEGICPSCTEAIEKYSK